MKIKRIISILATSSMVFCGSAVAEDNDEKNVNYNKIGKLKYQLSLDTGYRIDNFSFKIKNAIYTSISQRFIRDVKFEDVHLWQNRVEVLAPIVGFNLFNKNTTLFFEGSYAQGDVQRGQASRNEYSAGSTDSGAALLQYSATANSGDSKDYKIALGLQIPVFKDEDLYKISNKIPVRFFLSPKIGYSFSEQNFRRKSGIIDYSNLVFHNAGPNSTLDMNLNSNWDGGFIGLAVTSYIGKAHKITIEPQVQFTSHESEGNLYNNSSFAKPVSFTNKNKGVGYEVVIDYSYQILKNLALDLGFQYKNFTADDGSYKEYYYNGSASPDLNSDVSWSSYNLYTGLTLGF